jgi:diaminopimelate decarboxylase
MNATGPSGTSGNSSPSLTSSTLSPYPQPAWLPAATLSAIAQEADTPCYIYSRERIEANYARLQSAFASASGGQKFGLYYAVKANPNPALLQLLHAQGAGFDVVSVGEMRAALAAGAAPAQIVFAGVGKRDDELLAALHARIGWINIENVEEARVLSDMAVGLGLRARVALRVNPGVDPHTHAYLATGKSGSKFGVSIEDALMLVRDRHTLPGLSIEGLHVHNGSTITKGGVFSQSTRVMLDLVTRCRALGAEIQALDMGGGFGVSYGPDQPDADIDEMAREIMSLSAGSGLELHLEPGRYLVADACALVTRVLYTKNNGGLRYVIADAAMNDLIRPALYQARHMIGALNAAADAEATPCEVVGPVCESGDFLGHAVPLPPVRRGDLLAVNHAGAYGRAMASNYNLRPRAAEALIDPAAPGGWRLIRERERLEAVLAN